MNSGVRLGHLRRLCCVALAAVAVAAAMTWADGPARPTSIFDDNPSAPAPRPPTTAPSDGPPATAPAANPSAVVADSLLVVADDFVTDIYQNGQRVPDDAYKMEGEIYGATVMRVTIDVHPGDSLVFCAANDRFRWNGSTGLSVAGMLGDSRTPVFVSETQTGNWTGCNSLEQAVRFIKDPGYLRDSSLVVPTKPWSGCKDQMNKRCDWSGDTVWADGAAGTAWIRYVAPR